MFFAAHLKVVVAVAVCCYCSWRLATCQLSKLVKANRTKYEKDCGKEMGQLRVAVAAAIEAT